MTEVREKIIKERHALILAFLHWLKESKGGEIWTPDSWATGGMSPDNCTSRGRVDQFLCYESEKDGDKDG